jgi:hypothetical protein
MTRLGDIEPRERAGAKTGRRYDYQYERAARRVLDLLDHQEKHVCVYCDWHDDFVVERGDPPTQYVFHQVKGRKSGLGPWKFTEFFGLVKRDARPLPASAKFKKDGIVPVMLLHYRNFPLTCQGLAFVTNTGLEPQLEDFMNALKVANTLADLGPDDRTAFDFIALAYLAGNKPLAPNAAVLFDRLRAIVVWPDEPHLDDANVAITELVDLIEQYSEINLIYAQSKNIAKDVIERVREKAHFDKTIIPATDERLRQEKGIVVTELLSVLSLSTDGYEALRGGRAPVDIKTLSRLQRYCEKNERKELTTAVCTAKAEWDAWRHVERHRMDPLDFVTLIDKAKAVVAQGYKVGRMIEEARVIASEFNGLTETPLKDSHVFGLMLSIIAQAEPTEVGR